jgi:hypothetical protein
MGSTSRIATVQIKIQIKIRHYGQIVPKGAKKVLRSE